MNTNTHPHGPKEQMSIRQAVEKNGLRDEFIRRAKSGASNKDLLEWFKTVLAGQNVFYPADFRQLKLLYGCTGAHGGARANRGKTIHRVESKSERKIVSA